MLRSLAAQSKSVSFPFSWFAAASTAGRWTRPEFTLLSRRNPRAGLVALRQTFVGRCHRPTPCTPCCLDRAARLERDRRRRGGGSRSHDFCPAALNCAVSARRVPRFPARPAALGMAPMRTSLGQPLGEAGGNRHRLSVGRRRLGSAPPDGVKVNTRTIRAAFRGAVTPCLAQKRPYSSFPAAQRALGLPWRFPGRSQGKRWWWKGPPLLARRTQAGRRRNPASQQG